MTDRFKYVLCLWITCIVPVYSVGQEAATIVPWVAGSTFHTGFLMNHHYNMRIMNEQAPYAFELYLAKRTGGEKAWQSFYRNPLYGVSYMMFDMGSPTYLGKSHSVYPFIQFYLTNVDRAVSLNMRFGAGIAYMEKIFDRFDNYKNMAISTHFNAALCLRMEGKLRVAAPLYLSGGWAFTHMSNGTIKKPNAGLNFVTAYAGASYAFGKEKTVVRTDTARDEIDRTWHYTVYLSGGVKTYSIFDNKKYAASGLSLEASRSHLAFTRFSGILEIFYDASDYASLVRNEVEARKIQTVKPGLAAGYSFLFGELSAHVHVGRYIYAKSHNNGLMYQRLALRYLVTNRLNVHLGLKTHLGQADYVEFSIGYRIR